MTRRALPALLLGLAGLTAGAALLKTVSLAALPPQRKAPVNLQIPGYRVESLGNSPGQIGRDLSHGTIRRFRLTPTDATGALELVLVPMRARNPRGLQMAGFTTVVPELALMDRTLITTDAEDDKISTLVHQWALGRGPKNPPGIISRLQACVAAGGGSGITYDMLMDQLGGENSQEQNLSPIVAKAQRFFGLKPYLPLECLAVQLTSPKPINPQTLQQVWGSLRPSLSR